MSASETGRKGPEKKTDKVPGYGFRTGLSWLALTWERLWPRFWLATAIAILFVALVLFDVLPMLPGWLHIAALVAFAAAFSFALFKNVRRLRLPGRWAARRRLERTSGLDHRPLTATSDTIAVGSGDAFSEAIWKLHREKAKAAIKNLRVGSPKPKVARRDPYALRGLAIILLVLGLTVGWTDSSDRFARAFMPDFEGGVTEPVTIEAWFTPPDHTGLPPRMVTLANDGKPIIVPQDTKILLQLHGGKGQPTLTLGKQRVKLQGLDRSSWQGEILARNGGEMIVRQRSRNVVRWKISVTPDLSPKIAWDKDPEITQRQSVKMGYKATDDHNVKAVRVYIARAGEVDVITVKAPVSGGKSVAGRVYQDLTPHRWAGLGVSILFEAEDDLGQRGRSKFKDMTLPERIFRHPAARAIIAQRKRLTLEPEKVDRVVYMLGYISSQRKSFNNDPVVYLALRTAQSRLIVGSHSDGRDDTVLRQERDAAIRSVQPLLWRTALRIEEGATSEAEREMARIQKKLMELLSRKNIKDKELKRLLDELRKSMKNYMDALRREMKRNPQKFAQRPQSEQKQFSEQDIKKMLERMRDQMRKGDKEALRRMLSQLRDMMQNMRPGQQQRRQANRNHPAEKMMRQMGDLMRQQQKLMDESFRRGQQRRQNSEQQRKDDKNAARRQEELRKKLGEMMRKLGEMTGKVPKNFGNADREMRRSQRDLGKGRPGRSVGPQGRALRELGRGMRQAMRGLAQRFGMRPGQGRFSGRPNSRMGRDRDPLGRRLDGLGPLDQNNVKVPTEGERKKARDILRELRKRSGEAERPKPERDYIDRLLRRF